MAQNPGADPQIALNIFAGQVTNIDPVALPMGASPDCAEMQFLPGGTSSRPAFQKVFDNTFGPCTVTYAKSYVDPVGTIRNLFLDSLGNMWVENVSTSPGTYLLLTTTVAGSYAKSITAFGREYIAISDKLHGADIPLQLAYDSFGVAQLDRVTQDGPGASPNIISLALPSVLMPASSSPAPPLTIGGLFPTGSASGLYFTLLQVFVTTTTAGIVVGQSVTVSGVGGAGAVFNGDYTVVQNPDSAGACVVSAYFPQSTPSYTGSGTLTVGGGIPNVTMTRVANVVTVQTEAAHHLEPGYRAQITNVPAAAIGGGVVSIVVNNEDNPGLATVTTGSAHGLVPGVFISLTGVFGSGVGGAITAAVRNSNVSTFTTTTANGLSPGAVVTINSVSDSSFDGTWQILNVIGAEQFTVAQVGSDAASSGGVVLLNWPISEGPTPSYFVVETAPTPSTFQIPINYSDGTWNTGIINYAWDGTFFVQTVPSPTSFTYQQYGPDDQSTARGTVTPFGQAAPGKKRMQVFFITRQGYTTSPSPPIKFVANGGQYYSVSNIPIGPPNVVARAIAFTGAEGAYFFYIPSPPQENGQLVGTSTVINDNTTTDAIFDFGDPTLYAALGISIAGNNLANQIVIDGSLGFGFYGSRLFTYGQRNNITNLLNMGFDGGYLPSAPTLPTGWSGGGSGSLTFGHYGSGWITSATPLTQSMFEDYLGDPIANANDVYTFRAWIRSAGTVVATISSASTAFSSTATLTAGGLGWYQADFTSVMPHVIPFDLTLGITGTGTVVDEMSIIFSETPFLTKIYASYVNNPEGFDGVSGITGPVNDTHQVMDVGIIRDNLYMLTLDPSGRLHETTQGVTEPADWIVNEVAANCGAVSSFTLTRSQADDSSAAGGEEWFGWYSSTGYRIFGGESPDKISQEIQRPRGQVFPGAPLDLGDINNAALLGVWSLNDPQSKIIYLGIPSEAATAPSRIFCLSYLGLDSAAAIVANPPVHKSLGGKLIAMDLGRKWCPWNRPMNGGALMYRDANSLQPVFFGGNGTTPGVGGFGNVYILDSAMYTDDDYGIIQPYYITYGHPDRDTEQQLQLGGGLKMLTYLQSFFAGVGIMDWSVLYNSLANTWRLNGSYPMSVSPLRNAEWAGGQCTGQRFFIKFASIPNLQGTTAKPATDNSFSLSVLVVGLKKNTRLSVAGSWP